MASLPAVKITVIGTGLIGPRHAEAIVKTHGAELACIVNPNPAARTVATKLGCRCYESIQAMLASSKPDAALVCTPNHTHVSISKELLEGGVHVLCEKPISIDEPSSQELVDCAERHKRHLLIGHHRRFNRFVVATKSLIPSLGRLIAVNGLWTIYKPPQYFDPPTEWRRLDSAGPILINLVHEVDILHHLFGSITRVHAEQTLSQRSYAAEEGAAITFKFANGMVGTFLLSDAVVSPHNFEAGTGENPIIPRVGQDFYRIFGSEGSLSVPDMTQWSYERGKKSWTEELQSKTFEVPETKPPFELQIEHFIKVIRGEEAPSCSGADGLQAVVVCEAVKRSLQTNQPADVAVESRNAPRL